MWGFPLCVLLPEDTTADQIESRISAAVNPFIGRTVDSWSFDGVWSVTYSEKCFIVREALAKPDDEFPLTFAIITPDGQWHASGKMGGFGLIVEKKWDWRDQARAILEKHPGMLAVIVDCQFEPFVGPYEPSKS